MAEWFAEGLIETLEQKESQPLLDVATFYLVPNMNPDGTFLGNHRHNATGTDLNREWLTPHPLRSPEVQVVKERMKLKGVDFFLDTHGDETIPYVFLACHPTTPRISQLQERFKKSLLAATPDFQDEHGYKALPNTPINFNIAINSVSRDFDCLAFTLEMPFKDHDFNPDPIHGWSPQRSKKLAKDILGSIAKIIPHLR
jgi:murein tripeptide amidase MpaA